MEACEPVIEWMPLFVSERLAEAERTRLAAHLATCGSCGEELGRLFRLRSQLQATAERHVPSPAVFERVVERVEAESEFGEMASSVASYVKDRALAIWLVEPMTWARRIVDAADRLRAGDWTIEIGPVAVTPANES